MDLADFFAGVITGLALNLLLTVLLAYFRGPSDDDKALARLVIDDKLTPEAFTAAGGNPKALKAAYLRNALTKAFTDPKI